MSRTMTMIRRFSFRRLPEFSFGERIIHVLVTFGLLFFISDLFFIWDTDPWPVGLLIAIFGTIVESIAFALLEHGFFKVLAKRKRDWFKNGAGG